jgi:hypothetical protein
MERRIFVASVAAAQRDVATVLDAMHEHLGAAVISTTCGLHVHNSSSVHGNVCPGFKLATLLAFATLVFCCERALSQLLAADKR